MLAFLLCGTFAVHGARQDDVVNLISGGTFDQELSSDWVANGVSWSAAKSGDKKLKRMLQVKASGPSPSILVKSAAMVHLGDSLYFRAWMRSENVSQEGGQVEIKVAAQAGDKKPLIDRKVRLWHEWKEYKFAADTDDFYLAGQLGVSLSLPVASSIDLANVRLFDMGDTPASSLAQSTDDAPKKGHKKS